MEKTVAAVEFGSKKLKLVVGYELDGKVYVLYALTKPYGHIVEAGRIVDKAKIAQCLNEVKQIADPSAKLKISISEALLALPPFGLEIFQTKQVTTVISDEGKIGSLDIRNIYSLIKNGALPLNNQLIDVAPERYVLDQGRTFLHLDLLDSSRTVNVAGNEQRLLVALGLQHIGQLAAEGCLTRTLQTRHKYYCRISLGVDVDGGFAHKFGKFVVGNLNHQLAWFYGLDYILTHCHFLHSFGELLGCLVVDIGIKQRLTNVL